MKFTDGAWLMRKGVQALYPAHAYDAEIRRDSFTVYAPSIRVTGRGDTHDMSLLTVDFSSPMPDVIRVKLIHFSGQQPRPPQFELHCASDGGGATVGGDEQAISLTSGRLSAR